MLDIQFPVFPVLQTSRCLMRHVVKTDAPQLLALRSDAAVMQYLDREAMNTVDEAGVMIDSMDSRLAAGEGISWAVSLQDTNEMIGLAGLWRIIREHHRAEIGYTLLPAHWNKGLMSEVLETIIDFGFGSMKLHSIEANVNPSNAASIRLLEKLGFIREAYFRENYYFRGRFLDSAIYSLLNGKQKSSAPQAISKKQ
jgi:[ribosomal protein S5]-alanine N-acetyltransferase